MLRRPGECLATRRGEGCSSTAIAIGYTVTVADWINPAVRGSATVTVYPMAAVP
jgi:hypothetical protein